MEGDLLVGLMPRAAVGPAAIEAQAVQEAALAELENVYSFFYARVGNRADAEDLIQQVALKALPRLREGSSLPSVRAYLYATARSVLAMFWSRRFRLPEAELAENLWVEGRGREVTPSAEASERVGRLLAGLTAGQRQVLELRFLRGYSLRETAREMGRTVGGVKVLQLRALRAAAAQRQIGEISDSDG
jgi:RNA polymerase sigma factor (sigma-70 family)